MSANDLLDQEDEACPCQVMCPAGWGGWNKMKLIESCSWWTLIHSVVKQFSLSFMHISTNTVMVAGMVTVQSCCCHISNIKPENKDAHSKSVIFQPLNRPTLPQLHNIYVTSSFTPTLGHSVRDYSCYALSLHPSLIYISKLPAPNLPNALLCWLPLFIPLFMNFHCGDLLRWPFGSSTGGPLQASPERWQVSHWDLILSANTGWCIEWREKGCISLSNVKEGIRVMCWLCIVREIRRQIAWLNNTCMLFLLALLH